MALNSIISFEVYLLLIVFVFSQLNLQHKGTKMKTIFLRFWVYLNSFTPELFYVLDFFNV